MFLHEPGDDSESFTRQDLSSLNAISTQQPTLGVQPSQSPQPLAPPQHTHPVAAATQEQGEAIASPMDSPSDGPALPATASWADQARRASRTTSGSAGSPLASNSILATQASDANPDLNTMADVEGRPHSTDSPVTGKSSIAVTPSSRKPRKQQFPYFGDLLKTAFNPSIKFDFAFPAHFSEKDKWIVENMPPLFDPHEGTRRRLIKEREIEELQQQAEAQATQSAQPADLQLQQDPEGDEHVDAAGGSSQLGGEPEERPDRGFAQSSSALSSQQAIGSPTFDIGQGFGDLQGLGSGRVMTPQQSQQQLLLQQLKMAGVAPSGSSQQQATGHGRQNSRFFLNEAMGTASKNFAKQPGSAHYGNALTQNQGQFNYSAVQGPPPGLKGTGTPPVSGGGMFGQGHGFTQGGYGGNAPRENDKLWDLHRGRGNVGGGDAGKREFMFPSSYHQYPSTSASTPAQGAFSFPYGSQTGAYQESGGLQKQKKKGKKHRHANTSSSGGGVVDVADPSILQMRVGGPMAGQGGFAGQGQGGFPSSLHNNAYTRGW
jgi:CCR4-NOT transcription complex subunit 4